MTEPSPRPARQSGQSGQRPPVQYKGGDLDPERGPGLGCFWIQLVVLAVLVVLTPLSVSFGWSSVVSAALLFATIGLLLISGQTIIFLLRLVAADRSEGRRRPVASRTPTVGQLEDESDEPPTGVPAPDDDGSSGQPAGEDAGDGPVVAGTPAPGPAADETPAAGSSADPSPPSGS